MRSWYLTTVSGPALTSAAARAELDKTGDRDPARPETKRPTAEKPVRRT
jgi:hypothetical protein